MKALFFDLETTGIDYLKYAIIQFAGILVDIDTDNNFKVLDQFDYKLKPANGKLIDSVALDVNGYTVDELKTFETQEVIHDKFVNLLSKYCDKFNKLDKFTLIGYNNLHFDNDFLRQWFKECNDKYFGSWFWPNGIDLMSDAGRYLMHYRPAMANFKLGNVAKTLGIELNQESLHDGFYDITLTMEIFKLLLKNPLIKPFEESEAERIFSIKVEVESTPPKPKMDPVTFEFND